MPDFNNVFKFISCYYVSTTTQNNMKPPLLFLDVQPLTKDETQNSVSWGWTKSVAWVAPSVSMADTKRSIASKTCLPSIFNWCKVVQCPSLSKILFWQSPPLKLSQRLLFFNWPIHPFPWKEKIDNLSSNLVGFLRKVKKMEKKYLQIVIFSNCSTWWLTDCVVGSYGI